MSEKPRANSGTNQLKVMLAGGLAGAFSKTCTAPLGRMTILFQLGSLKGHDSVWSATKHVVHTQGASSLWRGHTATLLHRIPYSSVNFAVFENTKAWLAPFLKNRGEGGSYATESARYLIAGAAGGSTGCAVAYPLDLVKTKMAGNLAKEVPRSGALIECVAVIVQQQGMRGLYKGIGATLMQVTPTLAINFTAYELTKGYIASVFLPKRCPSQQLPPPPAGQPPAPLAPQSTAAQHAASREPAAAPSATAATPADPEQRAAASAEGAWDPEASHSRDDAACASSATDGGVLKAASLHAVLAAPRSVHMAAQAAGGAQAGPLVAAMAASRLEEPRASRLRGGAAPAASDGTAPADAIYSRALVSLVAGTVSGVVSSTTTFPLDVVRRRVQFAAAQTTYTQIVRSIYAEGGVRAFYRGLMPEYMKVIPGVSLAFCAYEVLKTILGV